MTSSRVALAVLGIFVLLGAADASAIASGSVISSPPETAVSNVRLDTRALQASRPLPNPARASRMAQAPRRNLLFRGS